MYIADRLIYLRLQKTASTHIGKFLQSMIPGRLIGGHRRLQERRLAVRRYIIGSIRNPWDWYVSLWAYGCQGKGGLYKWLTSRDLRGNNLRGKPLRAPGVIFNELKKPVAEWQRIYTDSN
jgi:hypothetical protein